ncbi:ABC transporter permease [Mucilaginibacter sp. KACC 22063]|uniref:ABC transporter permease n=1 Tax=Mucilaginibacter sp. KACC 22063 TaxID=3025666 RepID=UPI0023669050|nr:FtsX-like permease family protein [Mucilaginibacter sp. KACC 22063]WDF56870.1 ABC transporter permease [Mucilaginibacter sp. KACC 22063]
MSFSSFIAGRITFKTKRTFSKLIVRIAIIGIMLGLGVMILSVAVVNGFKQEIQTKIRGFSGDMQVIKYDNNNSYENSPFKNDPEFLARADKAGYISKVMPFATKPGIIRANDEIEGVVMKGVDKTYDWSFFKSVMESGTVINFADSVAASKQILISKYTANRLKLKTGDDFIMYFVQEPLRKRKFTIAGIFDSGVDEVDKTFVVADLAIIKRLNNWKPDDIGGYEIRVNNFDKLAIYAQSVTQILPINLRSYTVNETYPTIFEWLSLLDVNAQVMLVLMLLVAVINMISALLIMILERTTMIGMFKAFGATNWAIQKVFLYNATYLVGIGLVLGNLFSLGLGWFQYSTHFFKLDQASYYMKFVPIKFTLPDILILNAGTLVICMLVLIIPSMLVSRITPVRAIRFK